MHHEEDGDFLYVGMTENDVREHFKIPEDHTLVGITYQNLELDGKDTVAITLLFWREKNESQGRLW